MKTATPSGPSDFNERMQRLTRWQCTQMTVIERSRPRRQRGLYADLDSLAVVWRRNLVELDASYSLCRRTRRLS